MGNLKTKIINRFREMKMVDLIYPSISIIFLTVSIILFLISINFISGHINKALTAEESKSSLLSLDKTNFEPIKNKFNIKITLSEAPQNAITNASNSSSSTKTNDLQTGIVKENSQIEITEKEKSTLVVSILNGTKTSGLAGELKKIIEGEGFVVSNTGNADTTKNTILKIKKSKEKFKEPLINAMSEKYSVSDFAELQENDLYDIVIIIGNQR